MSLKPTHFTLFTGLALFGFTGCELETSEFDDGLTLDEFVQVAEKGLDSLAEEAPCDTVDCDDNDPTLSEREIKQLRQEAIRLLREMASQEECDLQGVLTGRYRDGEFKLVGHWWNTEVAGYARGIYERSETRRGGDFKGRYRDMSEGHGALRGVYADPGVQDELFGIFKGTWTPADFEESAGNIRGIWHPLHGPDNGVIFGVWSSCLSEIEPAPEPVGPSLRDERGG